MRDIVIECKPDEALIKSLGFPKRRIVHQSCRGEVINYLKKNPSAIGIVDEDPGVAAPSYMSKFELNPETKYDLASYHMPKFGTKLIVIKPRLEDWILKYASIIKIDPRKYTLPIGANDLHKRVNSLLTPFEKMIKGMRNSNSPALNHLIDLINQD